MPATTPKHGLPYPEGLDPVDVAGDIQRLAEAVDEGAGSGFTFVSDTLPTGQRAGNTWYQGTTGRAFVWFFDGTSTQWVEY